MKIGIVAGETSGSILGAGLLTALQKKVTVEANGIGGQDMMAAGFESLHDMDCLAVTGLVEPLKRLPALIKLRKNLYTHFQNSKPDIFIGIDAPDFNLGLEEKLRRSGIPVAHYVSPSVWAWRQKRVHKISRAVDLMLTLFPFEVDFYLQQGINARCVGHPLADKIPLQPNRIFARKKLNLNMQTTYIAVLPGSRRNELKYLGETFIKTAIKCRQENPTVQFITSAPNVARQQELKEICHRLAPNLPIHFYIDKSHEVMEAADVVLVASGTATLETMLFKRPMVIAYRMANLTHKIVKRLVKIPHVGMPNILTKKLTVPEFIQHDATPANLANALLSLIDDPQKSEKLVETFTSLHLDLRRDANVQAADAILSLLDN